MSIVRRLGVAAVVVALVTTLLAGNVVIAAHQTVLDPGFVTDTLEEENAYEAVHEEVLSNGSLPVGDSETLPPFAADLAGEIVTPGYIESQTEANIDRTYGYLHGSRDSLVVVVDTKPLKERTGEAVAAAVQNVSARELAAFAGFEGASLEGVPVNSSTLFSLSEGPESFSDSRAEVRSVARDRLLTRLVDSQFDQSSNDELLRLVVEDYNSDDYTEEEKEQLVADRESEIRTALREQIEAERGDEIDSTVETLLNQSRSDLKSQYATFDTGFGSDVDSAAGDLVGVYIDGLLAPDVTYDEFSADLNATKADLGTALGDVARDRLDEQVSDQLVLSNQLGTEARENVVRARAGVVAMDVLGWFLPLLALVLAGLIWVVSDAVETAVLWSGVAALVAGAPGYVAATLFGPQVEQTVRDSFPEEQAALADVAVGFLSSTLGAFSAQSLLLAVAGAVLVVVGGAVRFGLVDLPGSDGDDSGFDSAASRDSTEADERDGSVVEDTDSTETDAEPETVEAEPEAEVDAEPETVEADSEAEADAEPEAEADAEPEAEADAEPEGPSADDSSETEESPAEGDDVL